MKEMDSQSKLSLKLQAYQYLKTKILNCEYRPNEFLNEQKLCAEMGNISRPPLRDALGRLEQEGLMLCSNLDSTGSTEEHDIFFRPASQFHHPARCPDSHRWCFFPHRLFDW